VLMNFSSISGLHQADFKGFETISCLQKTFCSGVPEQSGIYLVIWPHDRLPVFLSSSLGGHFKGKNPTVSQSELNARWVQGSKVIYIGKAGSAQGAVTLRKRMLSYMKFGMGKPIGHWGGPYIWQIDGSGTLQICWKVTTGALVESLEKQLIKDFTSQYTKRPYANLKD